MAFANIISALVLALPLVNGLTANKRTSGRLLMPVVDDLADGVSKTSCAFLIPIVEDLAYNLFENSCGDTAHSALRLIFHDAIGISPTAGGGGADGSIAVFNATELQFPANLGVDDDLSDVAPFLHKYASVLSPGNFIQLAGAVSLAQCPGAPRVKFVMGRPQPKAASPPNLVPQPTDPIATILARFASVDFSPEEVIALLSSHSVAGADHVDTTIPGTPFDSTPSVFDTQIFVDVLLKGTVYPGKYDGGGANSGEVKSAIAGTLRLASDDKFARDPETACIWQSFVNNQQKMQTEFGDAVYKLSLLGQTDFELTDCSDVIPIPPQFNGQATFPPTLSIKDIEQSCKTTKFPDLKSQPGTTPLVVSPIPQADRGKS